MDRKEAKEFVKKIIKTGDRKRIEKVMARYLSKFWTSKKKEDIVEIARKIFYADTKE